MEKLTIVKLVVAFFSHNALKSGISCFVSLASKMSADDEGFKAALEEARAGAEEGGIPIGACLVGKDGTILGRGHNMRVQKGSAILHVRRRYLPVRSSSIHIISSFVLGYV
jgi:hypothetical protein